MGKLRRESGFWAAVGRLRLSALVTIEIGGGTALGVATAWVMVHHASVAARLELADSYLVLAASLLGIVFAAMALVVALFTDDYLQHLEATRGGVLAFLGPFMIAIGCQVAVVLTSVLYSAFATMAPKTAEEWAFGIITALFFVSVLDVVALARSVMMHGVARARVQKVARLEDRKRANFQKPAG